jgi:putative uncharacterized protein (fragment)
MAINFREFTHAMTQWMPEAPAEVKEHLRASSWKSLMLTGKDVDGGTVFSPQEIVERVLDERDDLTMSVAVPVALMLNRRFGPQQQSEDRREDQSGSSGGLQRDDGLSLGEHLTQDVVAENSTAAPDQESQPQAAEEMTDWIFPAYDYSREDLDRPDEPGGRVAVTVSDLGGSLRYDWPDAGQSEVYRVVVSDVEDPYSPDDFDEVAVTEGLNALDATRWTTAARFVTVWGYTRLSDGENYLGQCRRVASRVVVHPLVAWSLEFNAESRCVDASWEPPTPPPGATVKVRTARLPLNQPVGRYLRGSAWLSCEIPNNGAGFQDSQDLVGGKQHNYVAAVEVQVSGETYTSKPIRQHITPEVERERIIDLGVDDDQGVEGPHGAVLRLTWTQLPQSSVTIYRTQGPVDPAASDRATIPEEALAKAGLPQETAITAAAGIEEADSPARQLRTLSAVPWPDGHGWDTIYFTPVTFHGDGQVTIGATVQRKRAASIDNVTLIRRLDWDLVTFTWPGEATLVELRMTGLDAPFDSSAQPFMSVEHDDYKTKGGCVIKGGLPAPGGRLYLNAITYMSGAQISSPPVSIEVPSLWTYQYSVKWPGDMKMVGGLMRHAVARLGRTIVEVTVEARKGVTDESEAIGLTLLHNPEHLPLHAADGQRVGLFLERPAKDNHQKAVTSVLVPPNGQPLSLWFDHSDLPGGYFRLVVDSLPLSAIDDEAKHLAIEHFGLVDPPLSDLIKKG